LLAPPGVPDATAALLRRAFDQTMADAALLDETRKNSIDIDPLPAADLQKVVEGTFVIAPDVLERARKLSQQ
jgi:tripartite-type tricarboxylate transporter receptor subunit TctC